MLPKANRDPLYRDNSMGRLAVHPTPPEFREPMIFAHGKVYLLYKAVGLQQRNAPQQQKEQRNRIQRQRGAGTKKKAYSQNGTSKETRNNS